MAQKAQTVLASLLSDHGLPYHNGLAWHKTSAVNASWQSQCKHGRKNTDNSIDLARDPDVSRRPRKKKEPWLSSWPIATMPKISSLNQNLAQGMAALIALPASATRLCKYGMPALSPIQESVNPSVKAWA